jgi:ribosomal protein L33
MVVSLVCNQKDCSGAATAYVTRVNKKTKKNVIKKKFCRSCGKHTEHKSKEVKKGGNKK